MTNDHSKMSQMTVSCQNLTLGALSSRSMLSVLVGMLFKKFGLFLNTLCILHQPISALNNIKFMTSIKLLHVSAPGCHLKGVYYNVGILNSSLHKVDASEGDQYLDWYFALVFLCSSRLSGDGTPVPKYVGVLYSLYFIHLLVDIVNVRVCTARVT
jgi:hypothetical protein